MMFTQIPLLLDAGGFDNYYSVYISTLSYSSNSRRLAFTRTVTANIIIIRQPCNILHTRRLNIERPAHGDGLLHPTPPLALAPALLAADPTGHS